MDYEFDLAVVIGRFQPFHQGHLALFQAGLSRARRLLVLCGSADQPRTIRNPWHWQEREAMMRFALASEYQARLLVRPVVDAPYNEDRWLRDVQARVDEVEQHDARIALLYGGDTPRWVNLFPGWTPLAQPLTEHVSGTEIRRMFFAAGKTDFHTDLVPVAIERLLQEFAATDDYQNVREEMLFVADYRKQWSVAPYEPNFVTVDALVVQAGHILLVERKNRPGRGLLALPGGFLDPHEPIEDACLRELEEETSINLSRHQLRGCLRKTAVFDAPYRSARGRTITHVFHFALPPDVELPRVEAADDASSVHWVPLSALKGKHMFEDHLFIIQSMLGL